MRFENCNMLCYDFDQISINRAALLGILITDIVCVVKVKDSLVRCYI